MTKHRIPPTRFPDAVTVTYQRRLLLLVRAMHEITMQEFDRSITPQIQSYRSDGDELSAVQRLLQLISAMVFNTIDDDEAEDAAEEFVEGINRFTKKNLNDQAQVANINPLDYEDWIEDYVRSSIKQNVKYIKSIPEQYLSSVETIVYEGMKSGKSIADIREQLVKQYHVSRTKAQFIAVDQSGTIHGQLVAKRHQEMGVKKFEWVTSGDERVRESHRALSGKVYDYDKPPNGKVPGQDYRCRCTAYPVFSDEIKSYKEFSNPDEVKEFFRTNEFLDSLSQDEKDAITMYTTDYYQELNDYLRNKGKGNKQAEEVSKHISNALNKSVINDNIRLFRTIGDSEFFKKLIEAKEFKDSGFVSATPIFDFDADEFVLHLEVPKGTKAAYIDPISAYEGEEEVILDKNTSFRITKILDAYNILCEVVGNMKNDSKDTIIKKEPSSSSKKLIKDNKDSAKRRKDRFMWNADDVEFKN